MAVRTPSRTELEILVVLWNKERATAREIHQTLIEKGALRSNVAYTTLRTYLDRLICKGYASAEDSNDFRGTYLYKATFSRGDILNIPGFFDRIVDAIGLRPAEFLLWSHQRGRYNKKDREALEKLLQTISYDQLPN